MKIARLAALVLAFVHAGGPARAQETHRHTGTHTHDEHIHLLHFTHPLIAESVSPDTKVRLDFARSDPGDGSEWELEGEYAFTPSFSLEVGSHYESALDEFGHTHVTAKLASYALGQRGILLGFGTAVGIPMRSLEPAEPGEHHDEEDPGHGHGHEDAWEITPFVNGGIKRGPWELTGWARYTHAFERGERSASDWASYSVGVLLHATSVVQPLLELHGVAFGDESVPESTNLTPSLRVVPIRNSGLAIGAGVTLPISGQQTYDSQLVLSAFWHF